MFGFFIKDGNLKEWVRVSFVILGIASVVFGIYLGINSIVGFFFFIIGFVIAAIGGYASQAHMLRLKPFDNSCQKTRKSYDQEKDEQ